MNKEITPKMNVYHLFHLNVFCRYSSDQDKDEAEQVGYDLLEACSSEQILEILNTGPDHPIINEIRSAVFKHITADWVLTPDSYNSPYVSIDADWFNEVVD
jgi:hypothetical protein